ncbi:MAG: 4a-hydroxytetrahydrobiopterin dehydratase [Thermoanaerobaculia bacterium]|nr:4a-hydroxytetrahydrobiopterin dehydratase [Thermoanaerobaculia bacterium]
MEASHIQTSLDKAHEDWKYMEDANALRRTYCLPNFRAAIAFVGFVAELSETADHHPDIDIRYSKVTLTLSTHSAGGVTEKDFDLLAQIDRH